MAKSGNLGAAGKLKIAPAVVERFLKLVSGHERLLAAIGRL